MKKMVNGELVDMTPEDIATLPGEPDPAEALAAEQVEAEAKLRETDWVVVRAMEKYLIDRGITKDLPADVMAERGTARVKADKTPKPKAVRR